MQNHRIGGKRNTNVKKYKLMTESIYYQMRKHSRTYIAPIYMYIFALYKYIYIYIYELVVVALDITRFV